MVASGGGVLASRLKQIGVKHYQVLRDEGNTFGHMLHAVFALRRLIQHIDLDVVNPQSLPLALAGAVAIKSLPKHPLAYIVTIHMLSSLDHYRYARTINYLTNLVIVESECERQRLVAGGLSTAKTQVVYNCVDPRRFAPEKNARESVVRELGLPPEATIVGVVARLSPEKGHSYLLEAARHVISSLPNVVFLIVGDGPLASELRTKVADLEIRGSVVFSGVRFDVPRILSAIDIFVLPSLVESLPLSVREAMAMSKPVIATNVGGMAEAVIHDVTGLLVPPADPFALAVAIRSLVMDKAKAIEMGRAGRKLVEQKFNYDDWVTNTERIFENAIQQTGSLRPVATR